MKGKIFVQHRVTRAYVSRGDQHVWTNRAIRARLFDTPCQALHFCAHQDVRNVDVVFRITGAQESGFLRC